MTNGGKTTLTNNLLKVLPNCCVIHQDDFFKVAALTWGQKKSCRLPCPLLPTGGWAQTPPQSGEQGMGVLTY